MKLDEFAGQLEKNEKSEYEALVAETQAEGADPKSIRGKLARLTSSVLKRTGEQPNPGPIIAEFSKAYLSMPQKQEALPLTELSVKLPYPLGYELKSFLDEKKLFDSGENVPQFAYVLCAVMGLLASSAVFLAKGAWTSWDAPFVVPTGIVTGIILGPAIRWLRRRGGVSCSPTGHNRTSGIGRP